MSVQLIEKAQYTRCYKCGDTEISYVCHHCGRPMCKKHHPQIFHNKEYLDTIEFTGLGLNNTRCGEAPAHCEDCHHIVRKPNAALIVLGIIAAVTGIVFLLLKNVNFNNVVIGIICLFLGLIFGVSGAFNYKKRKKIVETSRPPHPLFPRFETIKIREEWHGRITLDTLENKCTYNIQTEPVKGRLRLPAKLTNLDLDRLGHYREKYNLGEAVDIKYHAGFVTFKGPVEFKLANERDVYKKNGLIISLQGDVNKQPYLNGASERKDSEWVIDKEYTLLKNLDHAQLPIRVVPSLLQKTGQRELELEVQWEDSVFYRNEPGSHEQETESDERERFELLELRVPLEYGEVEELNYDGVIGIKSAADPNVSERTITWKKPPIPGEDLVNRRCIFFVRFENKINLSSIIQGRMEIIFKKTLSMIEGIDFYYPLGTKNNEFTTDIEAKIIIDFRLSLKGLRYQDVRLVPNPKVEVDKDKQKMMTFEGVIPNHSTVVALTNAISNEGFYVQRVVEDPPRTGKDAHLINRCWDIAGRHYVGVYPIDFHLTVSGEEKYSGEISAQGGTTKTMLIVQGMYANDVMAELIENIWLQLTSLIEDTFDQLYKAAPAVIKEDTTQSQTGIDASTQGYITEERLRKYEELYHKHLENLREAFTAARVFENTYLELKTRMEKELQALQSSFEALRTN